MRTNTSRSVFSVGLLSAALLGCGGVDGIPIDKTAKDFADAICPKAYSCCTADQLMNNDAAGTSEAECKMLTADNFTNFLQGLQNSQSAKRSKFEQTKVDACLQTIRSADCATLNMTNHLSGVPGLRHVRDAAGGGRRSLRQRLRVHRQLLQVPRGPGSAGAGRVHDGRPRPASHARPTSAPPA